MSSQKELVQKRMKLRILPSRVIVFQFMLLLVLSCQATAQEVVWPVRWAGLADAKNGTLKWNRQEKKWRLQDPQGIELSPVDVQSISPVKQPQQINQNFISAGAVTALLSYQESLTGRLESISADREVSWKIFGTEIHTKLDSGSAWVMNPGYISLISEDFESLTDKKQNEIGNTILNDSNSPAGSRVLTLQKPLRLPLNRPLRMGREGFLFQLAFWVDDSKPGAVLSSVFESGDSGKIKKSVQLTIDGKAQKYELNYDHPTGVGAKAGGINPGWHWLHVDMKPGRTRFCIDGNVISEMKSVWIGESEIQSVEISAANTNDLRVDGIGFFQFADFAAPVQRPIGIDLIQLSGGHEWFGEILNLDRRELKFKASETYTLATGLMHAILPSKTSGAGKWLIGPVARVRFNHGFNSIWNQPDLNFLNRMGLISPPPAGESSVEGVIFDITEKELLLGLSQGDSISIPADRWTEIKPVGASGLRVLDSRPHHLGDEVDMKVIPYEPEGKILTISFAATDEEARYKTRLAVDILEVLGTNIQPFVDSLKKGELITEVLLNGKKIDNLNNYVIDRNDKPSRVYLEIPNNLLKIGENILEFRQVGLQNDPDYLDDLSILGVRLYRVD
jgi:hypothetical protein